MSAWPKVCGCGIQHSVAAWLAAVAVVQDAFAHEGELELRDCVCGSTIAVDVTDLPSDAKLWAFLGDELDVAALPLPAMAPRFTTDTVRPPRLA